LKEKGEGLSFVLLHILIQHCTTRHNIAQLIDNVQLQSKGGRWFHGNQAVFQGSQGIAQLFQPPLVDSQKTFLDSIKFSTIISFLQPADETRRTGESREHIKVLDLQRNWWT
jgi:hypothetical protein